MHALGVKYWKIADVPAGAEVETTWEQSLKLQEIREAQGFKNYDIVNVSTAGTPAEKLAIFFAEHLHEDEEIRFILRGGGCFDVRSARDRWVRIHVVLHDLIVIPAGIYHRFSLDDAGAATALRLFQDAPKWIAINRSKEASRLDAHIKWLSFVAAQATPLPPPSSSSSTGPSSSSSSPSSNVSPNGISYDQNPPEKNSR
ncbi:MAG: hypothetical protein Q8P67_02625 [archaeon]|nr:hypothetical protein [archaeon]